MNSEPLDVLIVGGGPGGTAAAFRARELGLRALILEYDDLMKRIRDYSKDKLILPSFGGGDQMRFPRGGDLVSCLCFDPVDKDDMCAAWKGFHRRHDVESHIGVELTGLERRADGAWRVAAWNHAERCDAAYLARHVVLAIGRGVPRRFDIPGNTDGIAFRLADAETYVGRPACVIGGGTSAAEAVIAVSNAKAAAGDPTAVYWAYRGDRMPRVSKALAEIFFGAYVGNGNIRYYPKSEPAAVVTADDHREYLSLRVDRRSMEGRPSETVHLEFPKDCCIACIGEDIPEALLADLGIRMAVGGPRDRKRMVVNRYLETEQRNVYLAGDILSQAYFETGDFDADPAGFREVKHRGNIKSALRDGVLVAQVIHQRLQGKTEIDVEIEETGGPEEGKALFDFGVCPPEAAAQPPAASLAPERRARDAAGYLVRVLPGGVQDDEYPVRPRSATTIGRTGCDVTIESDTLLSDRHASISHDDDGVRLRDDGSATGVFLRVPATRKLEIDAGDVVQAGRQFLLFGRDNGAYSFTQYDTAGHEIRRQELEDGTIVLGRKAPDVNLDEADGTLSRRHMALSVDGGKLLIKDLKSVNGTFLRVKGSGFPLEHGDRFRVGQQHFIFSDHADAVLDAGHMPSATAETAEPESRQGTLEMNVGTGAMSGAVVTFRNLGKSIPVSPGQTICEAAEAHGLAITAECHSGICGSDPIRILKGRENLVADAGAGEAETLEDICDLEAGDCRLACMARVKGPVEVELV
jgi:thioredoxin reductase/pSer/pThr/pTyr-binding forkhead associated (FHA) protein